MYSSAVAFAYRLFFLCVFVAFLPIGFMGHEPSGLFWIYFSNWCYLAQISQCLIALCETFRSLKAQTSAKAISDHWMRSVHQSLIYIGFPSAIIVSGVFWGTIYHDRKPFMSELMIVFCWPTHTLNVVFATLELVTTGVFSWRYLAHVQALGIAYLAFSVAVRYFRGCWAYAIMEHYIMNVVLLVAAGGLFACTKWLSFAGKAERGKVRKE